MQPKIKLKLTSFDIAMEVISWSLFVGYWVYILINYQNFPDQIPTHYGFDGVADTWGDKSSIFLSLAVIVFLFSLLSIVNLFPHKFNYLVKVTEENAERTYRLTTRFLRWMRLLILLIFIFLEFIKMQDVHIEESKLGKLTIPVILILLHFSILYFIVKSTSPSKKK
jgi:uncharacterized membrane protein